MAPPDSKMKQTHFVSFFGTSVFSNCKHCKARRSETFLVYLFLPKSHFDVIFFFDIVFALASKDIKMSIFPTYLDIIFFTEQKIFLPCDEKELFQYNGEPTLLVHCLYQMSPLNHKRTTSSLVPLIIYVAKNSAIKR